ncbi:MAG TPA: hypothetical protein PKY29_06095 [Ferruginibacter sp.]|nr:hypothetical protein [Ferruginibacter sp.]HRO17702.1 hypothetical protein [Ferruginibacter sp.]HRQ20867.1 hypothetical protein [Ferruginibacter sp.]
MKTENLVTLDDLIHYTYRLALENNAMLRQVIYNQSLLLKKNKLNNEFPSEIFLDLDPVAIDFKKQRERLPPFQFISRITPKVQEEVIRWASLNPLLPVDENEPVPSVRFRTPPESEN